MIFIECVLWVMLFLVLLILNLRIRDISKKLEAMHWDLESVNKNIVTVHHNVLLICGGLIEKEKRDGKD